MLRRILTVAKWEMFKSRSTLSPKSIAVSIALLIILILSSLAASESGVQMDDGIYSVAVTGDLLLPVVQNDNRFNVFILNAEEGRSLLQSEMVDMQIVGDTVYFLNTDKSRAALNALETSTKRYREEELYVQSTADNFYDAFPVWVETHYLEREQGFYLVRSRGDSTQVAPEEETPDISSTGTDESLPSRSRMPEVMRRETGVTSMFTQPENVTTPSQLSPPIPFESVLLSFLFIFPMYFITQFYSASIMSERVNRRCELLLSSPVRRSEIVIGKMLPYLAITLLTILGISLFLGQVWTSFYVLALLFPVTLFFLAVAFFTAILARSFKELTFISVFFATAMSSYLFLPAMFMNVPTISAISPMTFVVILLEGEIFTLGEYLFSTIPFYFTSIALLGFSTFIFREEDLFTQKPVISKALDVIESSISKRHIKSSVFLLSVIFIPFAFMLELMMLTLFFNVPLPYSLILFMVFIAGIEEFLKSIGIFTIFSRKIIEINTKNAIILAVISALGFFIGEKALVLVTLAPILASPYGLIMFGRLLFPLILHIAAVMVTALGIRFYGVKRYPVFLILSVLVHSAYNLAVTWGVMVG
ncbi:MAG: ABC transporter permease subunit [Halobacteriota archaeon]|nr:ABC transporter permease subunit [Halobacteriota archaeon]